MIEYFLADFLIAIMQFALEQDEKRFEHFRTFYGKFSNWNQWSHEAYSWSFSQLCKRILFYIWTFFYCTGYSKIGFDRRNAESLNCSVKAKQYIYNVKKQVLMCFLLWWKQIYNFFEIVWLYTVWMFEFLLWFLVFFGMLIQKNVQETISHPINTWA